MTGNIGPLRELVLFDILVVLTYLPLITCNALTKHIRNTARTCTVKHGYTYSEHAYNELTLYSEVIFISRD